MHKIIKSCIKCGKPHLNALKIKNFLDKGGKSVTKQFHINIENGKSVFFSPGREKNQKIPMRAYFAFGKSNPLREDFRQEEGSFCHYLTLLKIYHTIYIGVKAKYILFLAEKRIKKPYIV